MYRFALRPRWLLGHVVVLALVVLMVNLGLWQLRRLDEKREHNAAVTARSAAEVVELDALVPADLASDDPRTAEAEFRPVTVSGTFRPDDEVLVRSRSLEGRPGFHVLTPLEVGDGEAVIVNRGWVPAPIGEQWPVSGLEAPAGRVEVAGRVRQTQERGGFGPEDPDEGRLATMARVDVDRLQRQIDDDLYPVYVELAAPRPPETGLPTPLPAPTLSEGNHLSYAGQWFIFAAIAAGGWLVLVRRSARGHGGPRASLAQPWETGPASDGAGGRETTTARSPSASDGARSSSPG